MGWKSGNSVFEEEIMINLFRKIKNITCGSYQEYYGRDIITYWIKRHFNRTAIKCLDIGCGQGDDLGIVRSICPNAELFGIDINHTKNHCCPVEIT